LVNLIIRDFTLNKYKELCSTLQTNSYRPLTVRDYLIGKFADSSLLGKKLVIIRHDVDRKIMHTLRMAKLEYEMGIRSTYYFSIPIHSNLILSESQEPPAKLVITMKF
jgi:hypothetical protein